MDNILDTLRKIKALADAGVGGERENAKRKLKALLAKHGLTLDDVSGKKPNEVHYFRYKGSYEKKILQQCLAHIVSRDRRVCYVRKGRKALGFELSPLETLELGHYWSHYRRLWKKELELFFVAFIHKHDIFPQEPRPTGDSSSSLSEEEAIKIMSMMSSLSSSDYVSTNRSLPGASTCRKTKSNRKSR